MNVTQAEEIQATVDRMEREVRRIKLDQAVLLRRLNELKSTPRVLPQELLADIFSYVCVDPRSFGTPHRKIRYPLIQVISQVCVGWRAVARASPSLWANINVRMTTRGWASIGTVNILQLHMANAALLSFSITVDAESNQVTMPPEYYSTGGHYVACADLLRFIFCQNPTKIKSATVKVCPHGDPVWWLRGSDSGTNDRHGASVSDQVTYYPNLASLDITAGSFSDSPSTLPFQGAHIPHLRHLVLHCSPEKIQIPFDNLTTLHLSSVKAHECFDILARYPNLIEFHARLIMTSSSRGSPVLPLPDTNTIILNNLRTLAWDFSHFETGVVLMTSFRFPSLATLFCHYNGISRTHSQSFLSQDYEMQWAKFLAALPALRCLGQSASNVSISMAESLFKALCHINVALEELFLWDHINDSWQIDFTGMGIFLRCLEESTTTPSVRIKAIHLYEDYSRISSLKVIDLLLDMVESRRNLPRDDGRRLASLILHLGASSGVPVSIVDVLKQWKREQRARLDRLLEGGFRLRVVEGISPNYVYSSHTCGCLGDL